MRVLYVYIYVFHCLTYFRCMLILEWEYLTLMIKSNHLKGLNAPIVDVVWLVVFCLSKKKRLICIKIKELLTWSIGYITLDWEMNRKALTNKIKQTLKRCWRWRWTWSMRIFFRHISKWPNSRRFFSFNWFNIIKFSFSRWFI